MASSIREATIASDHFLVYFRLRCDYEGEPREQRRARKDLKALQRPQVRQDFAASFVANNRFNDLASSDVLEESWSSIGAAFSAAAGWIPERASSVRKPWISKETLALMAKRAEARLAGNFVSEKAFHKAVRKAVKHDKATWLEETLADGSWRGIRHITKRVAPKQGRLRNLEGDLVSSEQRADTMAIYLEEVQWRVRPAQIVDGPLLNPPLPVSLDNFDCDEVRFVMRKLRPGKASGPDSVPPEYWKVLADSAEAVGQVTEFVNLCWNLRRIPAEWRVAQVTALHKKGCTDKCENYRPISLLSVGYKVFAALVFVETSPGWSRGILDRSSVWLSLWTWHLGCHIFITASDRIGSRTPKWQTDSSCAGLAHGI